MRSSYSRAHSCQELSARGTGSPRSGGPVESVMHLEGFAFTFALGDIHRVPTAKCGAVAARV